MRNVLGCHYWKGLLISIFPAPVGIIRVAQDVDSNKTGIEVIPGSFLIQISLFVIPYSRASINEKD